MLQYRPLIVQSKVSLGSSREVAHGCGVSFINYLYLVPLIIGQNFCATCAKPNQTGPKNALASAPRRDGTLCGFDENPPVGKPAGLEKTRPQVDPRVHFYTRTRTRGFWAGFGCPRV
jgi:hypothetical protein